jgi:hypothetical protein
MATTVECPATSRSATTRPQRARIEPTERSMPAEMMTKVSPMPRIALIADCCITLSRLSVVRKCGEAIPNITTRPTSTRAVWRRANRPRIMGGDHSASAGPPGLRQVVSTHRPPSPSLSL